MLGVADTRILLRRKRPCGFRGTTCVYNHATGRDPAGCVSRSVEEARRPEIGELDPLPSTYDLLAVTHPLFITARIPLGEITRLDAGFPYMCAATTSGVMQCRLRCQRHYTDQGYSSPKASTPPSSPVRSAGLGEDLMQ